MSFSELLPTSDNWFGNLFLILVYGFILAMGSKLLSDGCELLMEVLSEPGLIGGFVLPVLGALPDACIVLASASGPPSVVEDEIVVGLGTLAGSSILLLTVTLGVSIIIGRMQPDAYGNAIDSRCEGFSTDQVITIQSDIRGNAIFMLLTTLGYLLIQLVTGLYQNDTEARAEEQPWSAAIAIVCALSLVAFSVYQVVNTSQQSRRMAEAQRHRRVQRTMHALQRTTTKAASNGESAPLLGQESGKALAANKFKAWKQRAHASQTAKLRAAEGKPEEAEEEHDHSKGKIYFQSILLMLAGTMIVCLFSDPMVDVLSDFSDILGLSSFYVSFIVTPLASNASEIISSLIFAAKKSVTNMSLTVSACLGASTLNSTLVLGVFLFLSYQNNIRIDMFASQTLAIVVVSLLVGIPFLFKRTFTIKWGFFFIAIYPVSLVLIPLFEKMWGQA